jgi:hypothetical protein
LNRDNGVNLLRLLSTALATIPFVASQSVCATLSMAPPDAPAAQVSAGRATMADKKPHRVAARTNSDRVRSLLTRQALRPKTGAAAARRGAATTGISSRRAAVQITGSASRAGIAPTVAGGARTSLSPSPASVAPNRTPPRSAGALAPSPAVRKGTLGGPRAEGSARLGGPVSGKAARAAALDGTQVQRRKY